jgi:hypothetical protein
MAPVAAATGAGENAAEATPIAPTPPESQLPAVSDRGALDPAADPDETGSAVAQPEAEFIGTPLLDPLPARMLNEFV